MQRILSVETSRNENTTSEFVSKRLCFSILFSIAFLFLLAGYLLGRYTTDRAILLKKGFLQQKFTIDENNSIQMMKNISNTMKSINNFTTIAQRESTTYTDREMYDKIMCSERKAFLQKQSQPFPDYEDFKKDVPVKINRILSIHLEKLANCFNSIDDFLRNISSNSNI